MLLAERWTAGGSGDFEDVFARASVAASATAGGSVKRNKNES